MNKKLLPLWRGLIVLFASLLAVFIAAAMILEVNRGSIDEYTNAKSEEIKHHPELDAPDGGSLYTYESSYKTAKEMVDANVAFAEEVEANGAVLLKNRETSGGEKALPLKTAVENKVSLVGKAAYANVLGGQMGSGAANNAKQGYPQVTLEKALNEKNITINPDLKEAYSNLKTYAQDRSTKEVKPTTGPRAVSSLSGSFGMTNRESYQKSGWGYDINEVTLAELESIKAGCTASFGDYKTSIVVLGRVNSEGRDYIPGEAGVQFQSATDKDLDVNTGKLEGWSRNAGAKDPLGLSNDERAMIEMAKTESDKVIVLINSNSMMEIPEVAADDGIDAILWIGTPGAYGMRGVVDVLTGKVNPSGKLPDTYVADNSVSPAAQNWDIFTYTNQEEIGTKGNNQKDKTNGFELSAEDLRASAYTVYAEGIYVGYKYYETRYADSVLDPTGTGAKNKIGAKEGASEWKYQDEVVWPFGYGLSYTTFEQTLESVTVVKEAETQKITAKVKVENTGSVVGKDVVQLYVSVPYTTYDKENDVEKSAIQLVDFAKVEVEPGAAKAKTVTIEADLANIASYDSNGAKTYILDDGTYYFSIGNGVHEAMNNILAKQNKAVADGMTAAGNADNVKTWTLDKRDETTFAKSKNGTVITNRLDNADLNYYDNDTKITYFSRSNYTTTFPKKYDGIKASADMIPELRNLKYEIKTDDEVSEVWGQDHGMILAAMKGKPFNDSDWDKFLEQITLREAVQIIAQGGNTTWTLDSIRNPRAKQADGPNGFSSVGLGQAKADVNDPYYTTEDSELYGFKFNTTPNAPIVAATFDKDLVYRFGVMLGDDSLWTGGPSIWAGGANQHRAPYEGRTHEYFSEDPILSYHMLYQQVEGAATKGCIVGPKHFAFNAIEFNRYGLSEFMTEQCAREGDLKCFQGAFESENCLGAMTAFNRIGCSYINGHEGLMQNILRGEWGFKGLLTTDMVNNEKLMVLGDTIMGGVTMMANGNGADDPAKSHTATGNYWEYASAENIANDQTIQAQLKKNMHYQWYAYANSNLMNGWGPNSEILWSMTWYRALYIAGITVSAVLAAAALAIYVLTALKGKED